MSNSSMSRRDWASRCRRGRNSTLTSCMSGLTRLVIRTRRSRPRRRRQHGSNRGEDDTFSPADFTFDQGRTICTGPEGKPSTRHDGGASVRRVANRARSRFAVVLLFRPCSAGSRPPERSGMNSCSPLYTTTMSAYGGDALLGFHLRSGLGLRGKRENSCFLPFAEPRQQYDLAIGELERVMIHVKHAPVDLAKDRNGVTGI